MRLRRLLAVAIVGASACVATYASLEQEVVTTNVTSYDFGTVPIGQTAMSTAIVVSPQSSTDDDNVTAISFTTSCPDFKLQTPGLPAHVYCGSGAGTASAAFAANVGSGSSCIPTQYSFTATFTPSFAGLQTCNVKIDYSPNGSGSAGSTFVTLSGTGAAVANSWTVTPSSLAFGDVKAGTSSADQFVVVKNTGTQSLTISGTLPPPYFLGASSAPLTSHSLAAGASETYAVHCMPPDSNTYNAPLSLDATPLNASVALTCRGIVTNLNVSPNPVSFGSTLVGAAPPDIAVHIANGGGTTVQVSNFRLATTSSPDVTIAMSPGALQLGSGSSTNVALHYAATTANTGPLGTLSFDFNDGSAQTQNIAISGDAQVGSIGTNPATLDFGPVCTGATVVKPLAIFANAPGKVHVSAVDGPANTQVTVPTTSGDLMGNHGNELTVMASVHGADPTTIDDNAVIHTNIPGTPNVSVPVHAVVLPAGIAGVPDLVHFGPVMIDTTTTAKEIVISNCSSDALMITGASIGGTDAADFTIVSPADPARTLASGESLTFLVVMSPHGAGPKTAQLVVAHSQGTTAVALDGDGYGGIGSGGGKDRETYYACSTTGGSAGAWPILLALLALRRRRK